MTSKKHFYCWYLGFTEVASCNEAERTREIVRHLVDYHETQADGVSKVTLTLADAGITVLDVHVERVLRKKLLFKVSHKLLYSIKNVVLSCQETILVH